MLHRRGFLTAAAGLVGGLCTMPIDALASTRGADLKFLFVFAGGGWDTTRVFAPQFGNPSVDMEPDAEPATAGGIRYVTHPQRPSVDAFLQANHSRLAVINGVLVRSVSHGTCQRLAMTGSSSGFAPDWPAVLAHAEAASYKLPHLVMSGPSFPADLGTVVARAGTDGQLDLLLSGALLEQTDLALPRPTRPAEALMDRFLLRRAAARVASSSSTLDADLTGALHDALQTDADLKDLQFEIDFSGGGDFDAEARNAVEALARGVSRCVTLGYGGNLAWDSHSTNDPEQSGLFEGLFASLGVLDELLRSTPTAAGTLADETVVVVLSELGRTPLLNAQLGKDHWPYTSMMLWGPGIGGNRVVGAYDESFNGHLVDPDTAEIDDDHGRAITLEAMGATLLQLADLDPAEHVPDADPVGGILT